MTQPSIEDTARGDMQAQVLDVLVGALGELDDGSLPGPRPVGPDTVLIGEDGLESLAFVTFAVALEEHLLDRGWAVSVFDVIPRDLEACTAGQLSERIAQALETRAR